MASYKVNLKGGGAMTVSASDPAAAIQNVIANGATPDGVSAPTLMGGVDPNGNNPATGQPGTTPLPNNKNIEFFDQQAQALSQAAAATQAQVAFQYAQLNQVAIPGLQLQHDQLAFNQATQAATQALNEKQLQLSQLQEQHQHEIATGQLNLSVLAEQHSHELGLTDEALKILQADQQAFENQQQVGINVMQLAASLHGDPFKQQQVMHGLSASGMYSGAIDAATGKTTAPAFQGTQGSAADTATIPYLASQLGAGNILQPNTVAQSGMANGTGNGTAATAQGTNFQSLLQNVFAQQQQGVADTQQLSAQNAAPGTPGAAAPGAADTFVGTPNKFGTGLPQPGVSSTFNAPGPNSPNDTAQGTQIPGTTGMFSGATQNYGFGPGQGSTSETGTRGTNVVAYDPTTGDLTFDSQFLNAKPRAVFNLWDETTGTHLADSAAIKGAVPGDQGPGKGWMGAAYVPGGNGQYTFAGVPQLDPTHQYSIRVALPFEGGGVGNEPRFAGSQVLALPRSVQPATPAPAPTATNPAVAAVAAPSAAATAAAQGTPPTAGATSFLGTFNPPSASDGANTNGNSIAQANDAAYNAALNALPDSPTQIVARNFNKMDPTTQAFITSGESAKTGLDQSAIQQMIQSTLPRFKAPTGLAAAS